MTSDDLAFLRKFFLELKDTALEPGDHRYVDVFRGVDDPIALLTRGINFSPGQSVQLFSGFTGTGKSTQLLRLRRDLEKQGYVVLYVDIEDYLNLSTPVDISDFLMCLAGAVGDQLEKQELSTKSSYWQQLQGFFHEHSIELAEFNLGGKGGLPGAEGSVGLKLKFKRDPSFRAQLQKRMEGHLTALVDQVNTYLKDCLTSIRGHYDEPNKEVVLLVDSIEHIRGTLTNAHEVQSSVEHIFSVQHEKLHLPYFHVVYTVHPYLRFRLPALNAYFDSSVYTLPMIKVHDRDGNSAERGINILREIVAARGDWTRLLGTDHTHLERIIELSGGYLRDLFGILSDLVKRAQSLPVSDHVLDEAIQQRRREYLPIAEDDVRWLAKIAEHHKAGYATNNDLPRFAHFLEQSLVFCYQNGEEWFDVHPLIRDYVKSEAKRLLDDQAAVPAHHRNRDSND